MSEFIDPVQQRQLQALFSLQRTDLAERAVSRLLQQHPRSAWLHGLHGRAYYRQQRWPEARAAAQEAVRLNPAYAYGHYLLGIVALAEGRPQQAHPHLQEALRLNPQSVGSHAAQGMAYHLQGRYGEALEALSAALALDPTEPDALRYRYHTLLCLERPTDAEHTLQQWLRAEPLSARAQQAAGQAALRRQDYAAAQRHLRTALHLRPDLADAKRDLAQALKWRFRLWRWLDAGNRQMNTWYKRSQRGHVGAMLLVGTASILLAYLLVPLLVLKLSLYLRWRLDPEVRRLVQGTSRPSPPHFWRHLALYAAFLLLVLIGVTGVVLDETWGYIFTTALLLATLLVAGVVARRRTQRAAP